MITPLAQDVQFIADSVDTAYPLCLSVQGLNAAQVVPYAEALDISTIVLDATSAVLILDLAARNDLGDTYVENHVRFLIRQARSAAFSMSSH